jgi:AraC-like DNA-binding protein
MQVIFNLQDGDHIPMKDGLPEGFRGNILQGAMASHAQTAVGMVVLQNYHAPEFSIQLGIFRFFNLVRSIFYPPDFPIGSLLSLKNDLHCTIDRNRSFTLKEKEFSFLHHGKENIRAEFEGNREYQILGFSWSPSMLDQTAGYFPLLTEEFKKIFDDQDISFISTPRFAGKKTLRLVRDLLDSPFDAEVNKVYIEYKAREYLLLVMAESSKTQEPRIFLSTAEKNKLFELGRRLQEDPSGKFPIDVLAKEMDMPEIKLKLAFKQIFGKGIFEFHLDQRMKEAHRLLKNSHLPTKMIASMTGYNHTTSFITRFREYFGYPPSRIQKKL